MIDGLSVLALIPARGGSKGVPRKNLREVGGKSLIVRAIEAAHAAKTVDRVVLSSDDPEIMEAARAASCEVPFARPAHLACDEASSVAVVCHALESVPGRHDLLVLLQPTSPLRTGADIDGAVRLCIERAAPACVSVCLSVKSPYWMFRLDDQRRMAPIHPDEYLISRRQDLPKAFAVNGAVFVARCDWITSQVDFITPETVGYVMPKERSVDIDDELDLAIAEIILEKTTLACAPNC